MTSTDSYRSKLQTAIASLRYWAPQLRPGASIEEEESESHWRLAARPHVPNACAFELVLHSQPRFDLLVADETYEDLEVDSLELFLPLLTAISDGDVVQRTTLSRNTGAWRTVETFVTLPDGTVWRGERINEPLARAVATSECVQEDRHFAPYLRDSRTPAGSN